MNMELLKYAHQLDELSDFTIVSVHLYNTATCCYYVCWYGA